MEHVISNAEASFVDIIWNLTLVCPWDCRKCCVDAVHVQSRGGEVVMRSNNLTRVERIPLGLLPGRSAYDQAAALRQRQGLELDLAGKLRVLNHMAGSKVKLDFSGGDPLMLADTPIVMRRARDLFGQSQITLTATGPGLSRVDPAELADMIGELNFTYDGEPVGTDTNCPPNYAHSNLRKARQLAAVGVATRAECPLTLENLDPAQLDRIFGNLHEAGIDRLLVMRLFPVGRGETRTHQVPTREQYIDAIAYLRALEARHGYPKIKLQCALKHLAGGVTAANPCDAIRESFGLMANGTLLGSPWAINRFGQPIDPAWVLGNLADQTLDEVLQSQRVLDLQQRLDTSWGHCKIFSYLYGASDRAEDRMMEAADPLYTTSEVGVPT